MARGCAMGQSSAAPGLTTTCCALWKICMGPRTAGSAAQVRPIVGPFTTDPAVSSVSFRQGFGGYAGALDTQLWQETPDTNNGASTVLTADLDTSSTLSGNQQAQVLVR